MLLKNFNSIAFIYFAKFTIRILFFLNLGSKKSNLIVSISYNDVWKFIDISTKIYA